MLEAVFSIRKKYLDLILSGEKRFEFRRCRVNPELRRIYFYVPEDKAVMASADVKQIHWAAKPATLYNSLDPKGIGITPGAYFDYFAGARSACGIELENVAAMAPTKLAAFGMIVVPQSYAFVKE